jgi:hypothetical protein
LIAGTYLDCPGLACPGQDNKEDLAPRKSHALISYHCNLVAHCS